MLETKKYDKLWEEDRQKKIRREEMELKQKKDREQLTIQMLTEQVEHLRIKAQEEVKLKKEEAKLMVFITCFIFLVSFFEFFYSLNKWK